MRSRARRKAIHISCPALIANSPLYPIAAICGLTVQKQQETAKRCELEYGGTCEWHDRWKANVFSDTVG